MNKALGWTMVAVMSLGGFAACSSDSKSTTTTKATTSAADSGESSGNASVDEFCKQADDLADKLKEALADPTSANAAEVSAAATKLTTDSAALLTANPNDSAAIQACIQKLADAVTPNG